MTVSIIDWCLVFGPLKRYAAIANSPSSCLALLTSWTQEAPPDTALDLRPWLSRTYASQRALATFDYCVLSLTTGAPAALPVEELRSCIAEAADSHRELLSVTYIDDA